MKVKNLRFGFLLDAVNGQSKSKKRLITGISIDSRTVRKGEVFFALKGENYDGIEFVKDALGKGASYVIVDRNLGAYEGRTIKVRDTLFALGELARKWRKRFSVKCLGITGTGGKTTTRRIINHLLRDTFRCSESMKNYNNMIGLPLSTLQIDEKTEIAILEMAMNHKGEIRRLAHIASPELGIITNVGRGHLEFLGSVKNVAKAKAELLAFLKKDNAAILNADDPYTTKMRKGARPEVITFGIENEADFTAGNIKIGKTGSSFYVNGAGDFQLKLPGRFNIYNALAAISTASLLGLNTRTMRKRLRTFRGEPLRLNRIVIHGITIYDDSYNANPDSMNAAISVVAGCQAKRKIACLGDMLELGKRAREFHSAVGRKLIEKNFDIVFLYGPLCVNIVRTLKDLGFEGIIKHFKKRVELTEKLINTVRKGDIVLIKGSHRNRLDITTNFLVKYLRGSK